MAEKITAARIERALNRLAEIIVETPNGHNCLPIYKRLKDELVKVQKNEGLMAEIRERAKNRKRAPTGRKKNPPAP